MESIQHNHNSQDHQHQLTCKEILQQVELALDGELTHDDEEKLIVHLNGCSHCAECYEIEKAFKEYVSNHAKRQTIPASLVAHIRERIQSIGK